MPELPEVETIVSQLAPRLCGRVVRSFDVLDAKLKPLEGTAVVGRVVRQVIRRGKMALFELITAEDEVGALWLAVHLRMTGRLIWAERSASMEREGKPRLRIAFDHGTLSFFDVRRLGVASLFRSLEEAAPTGLEPLERRFTARGLSRLLQGGRQPIKPWLMNQGRVAGIGNIYASEILFASGIDPRRPADSLNQNEIRRLHAQTRRVLRRAIRCCGVTFSDFQDSEGRVGSYQKYLRVYGRAGEPCRMCGTPIQRIVQQQRSTFFCPKCQR
ncbi:MAG: bifunctional DNA-formamidopyrimidine glycosylase/DNA-(apurinic or apyrimidinic site) lyase [Candidatus Sumerlaeota bacterium]|nr:bifunctional DNA-formamidopyrimidine glycosylase/DNA-(apurinic or apyrimidinic site) lyase [Candidatus Sumerlaeota bacterium]